MNLIRTVTGAYDFFFRLNLGILRNLPNTAEKSENMYIANSEDLTLQFRILLNNPDDYPAESPEDNIYQITYNQESVIITKDNFEKYELYDDDTRILYIKPCEQYPEGKIFQFSVPDSLKYK